MSEPGILLHCRAGFEGECLGEALEHAGRLGAPASGSPEPGSAHVLLKTGDLAAAARLATRMRLDDLVFARELLCSPGLTTGLVPADRIGPLVAAARPLGPHFGALVLEWPDTNEGRGLHRFCRRIEGRLRQALHDAGLLPAAAEDGSRPVLHYFFLDSSTVYPARSEPGNASPWSMGIPRLKVSAQAPSRSSLKLEEALHRFLTPGERMKRLRPGLRVVDLGAAPGGWSWVMANRGLQVTAIDNGRLDPALLSSGRVRHLRSDGFTWLPPKPVDWLLCDMVEQPARIAGLMARWFVGGLCREAIFNLKLPMRRRREELARCRGTIEAPLTDAGMDYVLRFKQLYHDREEVTGYWRRLP